MQQFKLYFKAYLICFCLSIFSLLAQKSDKEKPLMSAYEFKSLTSSKEYKSLLSQIPDVRMRPYRLEGNIYEKLLAVIEKEVELMGLSAVELTQKVNNPLVNSTFEGLFLEGVLEDKSFFRLDIVNESYKEKYPSFFEHGGLFLLNPISDWSKAEVSMYNRMLIATQSVSPKDKPSFSMIQVRLSDFAAFSLINFSDNNQVNQLKEKLRGIRFNELISIVNNLKDINAEKLKFVNYIQDKWNVGENEGEWGTLQDMEFSYIAEGDKLKFGFACEADNVALEEKDYFPYEIKYKRSSGEVIEEELDGVSYYYYPKTNGQNMLFAYDGKSFVNMAIEEAGNPSAVIKMKVKDFFNLTIDCEQHTNFQKDINVLYKRLEEDAPRVLDLKRSMSFNTELNRLKSSEVYGKFVQLMDKIPKADSIKPFTDSTNIKEDFTFLLEPIKEQLKSKIKEKNRLITTDFVFKNNNVIPAKVLSVDIQPEGKHSKVMLTLTVVNESYKKHFDYLEPMVPFMLSEDGFLVDSLYKGKINIKAVGGFPAAYTYLRKMGGVNVLVVFVEEYASLTLMGLKENYTIEDLTSIVEKLKQGNLMAFAQKYKDVDAAYWSFLETFPDKVFEQEQTAISTDSKVIKEALNSTQEGSRIFFVSYGHPHKLLEGGHYYFMINCSESSPKYQEQLIESGYEGVTKGKYTIYSYEQTYKGNKASRMYAIVHKDYPNKQIIHTVAQPWEKSELKEHFGRFFEAEINCELFK